MIAQYNPNVLLYIADFTQILRFSSVTGVGDSRFDLA